MVVWAIKVSSFIVSKIVKFVSAQHFDYLSRVV
jgi:hypothetical protein